MKGYHDVTAWHSQSYFVRFILSQYLTTETHYQTLCVSFVSEVEDYSLCGYCCYLSWKREQRENEDVMEMKQHGHCLSLKLLSPKCSYQSIIIHTQYYATCKESGYTTSGGFRAARLPGQATHMVCVVNLWVRVEKNSVPSPNHQAIDWSVSFPDPTLSRGETVW